MKNLISTFTVAIWAVLTSGNNTLAAGPEPARFSRFDKNQNGSLDSHELKLMRDELADLRRGSSQRYDVDKDGKLSATEQAAGWADFQREFHLARHRTPVTEFQHRYHPFDANKNGRLEPHERSAFSNHQQKERAKFVRDFDLNKNGQLEEEELALAIAEQRNRLRQAAGMP